MASKKTSKKAPKKAGSTKTPRRISTGPKATGDADPPPDEDDGGEDEDATPKPDAEPDAEPDAAAPAEPRRTRKPKVRQPVDGVFDVLNGIRYTSTKSGNTVEVHSKDGGHAPVVDDLSPEDADHFLEVEAITYHLE